MSNLEPRLEKRKAEPSTLLIARLGLKEISTMLETPTWFFILF